MPTIPAVFKASYQLENLTPKDLPPKNAFSLTKVIDVKIQEVRKDKISTFHYLILKVIQCLFRCFKNLNKKIQAQLDNYQVKQIHLCHLQKFKNKIAPDDLSFDEIEKLGFAFAIENDFSKSILGYKACKYIKTRKIIQLLKKDLEESSASNFNAHFNQLPESIKRALYQLVCLSQNKKITKRNFAKNQIQKDPKFLLKIRNPQSGETILQQLEKKFLQMENIAKDSLYLGLYDEYILKNPSVADYFLNLVSASAKAKIQILKEKTEGPIDALQLKKYLQCQELDKLELSLKSFTKKIKDKNEAQFIFDTSLNTILSEEVANEPLTITMIGVEYASLVKEGGLGEALEGLTKALFELNPKNKLRLIFPKYSLLPNSVLQNLKKIECKDSKGNPLQVYKGIFDHIECYFIEHLDFNIVGEKPSIYGTNDSCKSRFVTFSSLAAELVYQLPSDIIHLHDWHAAGVALKLHNDHKQEWEEGKIPPIVFTFHNNNRLGAQGRSDLGPYNYSAAVKANQFAGFGKNNGNIFFETIAIADAITTVSPTFSQEAQQLELGEGVSSIVREAAKAGKLTGIINGINIKKWNPATNTQLKNWIDPETLEKIDLTFDTEKVFDKKYLAKIQLHKWIKKYKQKDFNLKVSKPIVAYIGRFDYYQKGMELLEEAIISTLKNGGQFIIMGIGDEVDLDEKGNQRKKTSKYVLDELEKKYGKQVLFIRDFRDPNGRLHFQEGNDQSLPGVGYLVRAATDFVIMPSKFEPCGLVQFESWMFGSEVIGSNTGGLADTIITREKSLECFNGYLFDRDQPNDFSRILKQALGEWHKNSIEQKNVIANRIIEESKKYGWYSHHLGAASPVNKYRFVYQLAKKRQFQRKNDFFSVDIDSVINGKRLPHSPKLRKEHVLEDTYLKKFYKRATLSHMELIELYEKIPAERRAHLPLPYVENLDYKKYLHLGAQYSDKQTQFSVEAPHAKKVSVKFFNDQYEFVKEFPLIKNEKNWSLIVDHCPLGQKYQLMVNGVPRIDPYALQIAFSPDHSEYKPVYSVVTDRSKYKWKDEIWLENRLLNADREKPICIYEMHPSSWMKNKDGSLLNYKDLAHAVVKYCKEMNFTHVELMGILEHLYHGPMGCYLVSGFFSIHSKLGLLDDFKFFIDYLHQQGIGVILDWVPAHFAKNPHGLTEFDGTKQFEPTPWDMLFSNRKYFGWGSNFFDYSKQSVREFLLSSAHYFLDELHIDGFRVDAVKCILNSENNKFAKLFLKEFNNLVHAYGTGVITMAEDVSMNSLVTKPIHQGGMGFDMTWNMGASHIALNQFSISPSKRSRSYESFIDIINTNLIDSTVFAISHDSVKKENRSLFNKLKNEPEAIRYANIRLLLSFMMSMPGKKLLFMGSEIAAKDEWDRVFSGQGFIDLEKTEEGIKIQNMVAHLNKLYQQEVALFEKDYNGSDVEWIEKKDPNKTIVAFYRKSKTQKIACVHNIGPKLARFKLKTTNEVEIIFSSDEVKYGGKGTSSMANNILTLAPCSTVFLKEITNPK